MEEGEEGGIEGVDSIGFGDGGVAGFGCGTAGGGFGEKDAQGVEVGRKSAVLFAGHVAGGADDGRGFAGVGQEAEVGEDGAAGKVEDVRGFDVAVDEAVPLEAVEGRGKGFGQVEAFGERQGAAGEEVGGQGAGAVLVGGVMPVGAKGIGRRHGVGEGASVGGDAQFVDWQEGGMEGGARRRFGVGQGQEEAHGAEFAGGRRRAVGVGGDVLDGPPDAVREAREPDGTVGAFADGGCEVGLGEEGGEGGGDGEGRGHGEGAGGAGSGKAQAGSGGASTPCEPHGRPVRLARRARPTIAR